MGFTPWNLVVVLCACMEFLFLSVVCFFKFQLDFFQAFVSRFSTLLTQPSHSSVSYVSSIFTLASKKILLHVTYISHIFVEAIFWWTVLRDICVGKHLLWVSFIYYFFNLCLALWCLASVLSLKEHTLCVFPFPFPILSLF